jgi:hypothetical protein
MMRLILAAFWGLVIFWLVTSDSTAQSATKGRTMPVRAGAAPQIGFSGSIQVEGHGLTVERAKSDALEQARDELVKYLRGHNPPALWWVPSPGFIKERLVSKEDSGREGADLEVKNVGKFKTWVLNVRTPDAATIQRYDTQARDEQARLERAGRMQERMGLLGKVLTALIAGLALVFGYIRLDELTQRAYTHWLRVALVSSVGAAGIGLWLFS